jgi:tRNA threonylcarbamoyladenosine biosynthesis protein TsaE
MLKKWENVAQEQLKHIAETVIVEAINKQENDTNDRATTITLSGDLGSGKTTFVKMVAKVLGVEESVTSPTFVIMKKFAVKHPSFHTLVHVDAYRLEKPKELEVLDWDEMVHNTGTLVCIEWPERVQSAIPSEVLSVSFYYSEEAQDRRNIQFIVK